MDEEVLVFPSHLLDQVGSFRGFSPRVGDYLPILLDPANLSYLSRERAENDPSFKQVIPYAVLRHGQEVFTYTRGGKGSEARLHARLSLGIGGHICRLDGAVGPDAYSAGYARELAEEVHIDSEYDDTIVGLVHDDTTPVGSVHFGVVHLLDLSRPRVTHRDPALVDAGFQPCSQIRANAERLESWSAIVFEHLFGECKGA